MEPIYEGNIQNAEERRLIVDSQPKWRKAWLQKHPTYLLHLVEAPKYIRDDLSYCPVPRVRSWKEHEIIQRRHPTWLNYPKLPGPKAGERISEHYMVKTLKGAIKLFTGSPDLSCIMLRQICKSLLTVLEVFLYDRATDSIFFFTTDTRFRCVYDLSKQPAIQVSYTIYIRG